MTSICVVTVDGPSGAGKGTVCSLLAQQLGFHLLDSGALYRLTALAAMKAGVDLSRESDVQNVATALDVSFDVSDEGVKVMLSGEDVSTSIRSEQVGMNASIVAAYPSVREALLARQREFASAPGLVADGRDMGTVVFPQADVKVFLTASAEERAKRRFLQLKQAGVEPDMESILVDIVARDERDSSRKTSPLVPAKDALIIDSTDLSVDEVVDKVLKRVNND